MSDNEEGGSTVRQEQLALLLRQARGVSGLSMRAVAIQARISSTYLGQLEAGTIKDPSPRVLYRLAATHGDSYAAYMRAAGYIVPTLSGTQLPSESSVLDIALRTTSPLTDDERSALNEYLAWYRFKRSHPPEK